MIGRISSDPELFSTERGTAMAHVRVAVDPRGLTAGAVFASARCFEARARRCAEHLPKQRPIPILRKLKLDGWEPTHGSKRLQLCVVAQAVRFISGRPEHRNEECRIPDDWQDVG